MACQDVGGVNLIFGHGAIVQALGTLGLMLEDHLQDAAGTANSFWRVLQPGLAASGKPQRSQCADTCFDERRFLICTPEDGLLRTLTTLIRTRRHFVLHFLDRDTYHVIRWGNPVAINATHHDVMAVKNV